MISRSLFSAHRCTRSAQASFTALRVAGRRVSTNAPDSEPPPSPVSGKEKGKDENSLFRITGSVKRHDGSGREIIYLSPTKTDQRATSTKEETEEDEFSTPQFVRQRGPPLHTLPIKERVLRFLRRVFLPAGHPSTVTSDYIPVQSWIAAHSLVGSATYVLSTAALLSAVGVGGATNAGLAASISWVLKDGFGSLGVLAASGAFGSKFDRYPKRSKILADLLHNVGVGLELATPLFPFLFVPLASLANTMKAIAGMANGATRVTVFRSFSKSHNLGDITAKSQAQATLMSTLGMSLGIGLSILCDEQMVTGFMMFSGLAAIHVFCAYKAMDSVVLDSIDDQRGFLLIKNFRDQLSVSPETNIFGMSLREINKCERFIRQSWRSEVPMKFFYPIDLISALNESCLHELMRIYRKEQYILSPVFNRNDSLHINHRSPVFIAVSLREGISPEHQLKAFYNAFLLGNALSQQFKKKESKDWDWSDPRFQIYARKSAYDIHHDSLRATNKEFVPWFDHVKRNGWDTRELQFSSYHRKITYDFDQMETVK